MRLGLLGDIHGDIRALELVLSHLESHEVKHILCAGDIVGYGAQPDAVAELLQQLQIPTIRGNHDRWAIEKRKVIGLHGWRPARLKDDTWQFLENLPTTLSVELAGRSLVMHHGSPTSDMEFVTPYKPLPDSVEQFFAAEPADVLILAHSHIPMIDRTLRGTILNAGSTHGVPGVQTSYTFALLDLDDLAIRIMDIRLGREIRRDPIFLSDEDQPPTTS